MAEKPERKLSVTYGDQVFTRRQTYLDDRGILPTGTLTIFAGRGGEGKTTLALDYVARVTKGTLEGDLKGKPRRVLIVSHEDDLSTQLVPRLIAAGATRGNFGFVRVSTVYGGVDVEDVPSLVEDQALLQQAIDENEPALIVLDPLTSSIVGDPNKLQDVRRSLQPLTALLHKNNLACIGIAHQNKGASGYAGDRVSGSHAFRDVARSLVLFATDNETGDRVFTVDKSSYGNVAGTSYGFRLVGVSVPVDEGGHTTVARVEHLGTSRVSVSDLWARDREPADSGRTDAKSFVEDYLESVGGSARAKEVTDAGELKGISERTSQDAAKRLGVSKTREGKGGPVVWHLRAVPAVPAVPADANWVAPTAPTAGTYADEGPL